MRPTLITDILICNVGEPGVGAETGGSRVQDTSVLDFQLGVKSSAQGLSVQLGEATHELCVLTTV